MYITILPTLTLFSALKRNLFCLTSALKPHTKILHTVNSTSEKNPQTIKLGFLNARQNPACATLHHSVSSMKCLCQTLALLFFAWIPAWEGSKLGGSASPPFLSPEPQVGWAAQLGTRRVEPPRFFLSPHLETDPQPSRSSRPPLTSQLTSSAFIATPRIGPLVSFPSPVPVLKVAVKPFSSF